MPYKNRESHPQHLVDDDALVAAALVLTMTDMRLRFLESCRRLQGFRAGLLLDDTYLVTLKEFNHPLAALSFQSLLNRQFP